MKYLPFFLCILLLPAEGSAQVQNPPGRSRIRKEVITVIDSLSGFTREVTETNITAASTVYHIGYTSLESIKKVDYTELDNFGKPVRSEKPEILDVQVPSENFYTCLRAKSIQIKEKSIFRVHFTSTCSDLLLLSALHFAGTLPIDTFYFEIRLPAGYHLDYQVPYPEMLDYFNVDSVRERKFLVYFFSAVPRIKTKQYSFQQINDQSIRKKACMARIIITPMNFAGRESTYFNNRLSALFNNAISLDETSLVLIDSITKHCSTKDSIIETLIGFIRRNIRYLDVEEGYGAFIPGEANRVLKERQGDCKGMSNLLCQALRHKDVEAYLALTATFIHPCDMNYPSISSGNHMICVVKQGEDWIFLDPTDKEVPRGMISPGIQGRTAFFINYHDGIFVPVPLEKGAFNAEYFTTRLKLRDNILEGTMDYTCTGAAMEVLGHMLTASDHRENERLYQEVIRHWMQNAAPSNPMIFQSADSLSLQYDIRFGPSLYVVTPEAGYLSLGLLPMPIRLPNQEFAGCDILLGHSTQKTAKAVIDFGKDISVGKFKDASFHEGGLNFDLACSGKGSYVCLSYNFNFDDNVVREEDIPLWRKFETFLDETLKQVISIR